MNDYFYSLFGFTLASETPLPWLAQALRAPTSTPDLTLTRAAATRRDHWQDAAPLGSSRFRTHQGKPRWELHRLPDCYVLHYPEQVTFTIAPARVTFDLLDRAQPEWVQVYFLSAVIAFWLELRGVVVLHASAVQTAGGIVGFASASTGGKSSLAAAAVAAGYPLVTDDLLALEARDGQVWVRPGFPSMRLWPPTAAHFVPGWQELQRVEHKFEKRWVMAGAGGWGAFCAEMQPLSRLYFPRRRDPDDPNPAIVLEPLAQTDAVIELVRHSFAIWLAAASGLQGPRLPSLGRIVQQAALLELHYPHGLEHLVRVVELIARPCPYPECLRRYARTIKL